MQGEQGGLGIDENDIVATKIIDFGRHEKAACRIPRSPLFSQFPSPLHPLK